MKQAAAIAAIGLFSACAMDTQVIEDTGRTIELMGGPGGPGTINQGIDYHQPTADRMCRERGYRGAQSAGHNSAAFILSYTFTCVE